MNDLSYELKNVSQEDRALVKDIHHGSYREVVERQFGSWDAELQNSFFNQFWDKGSIELIVVEKQPVGFIQCFEREDHIFVAELVIAQTWQGRGLGTQNLRRLMSIAKERSIALRLQALKQNVAIQLYERLNFRRTGETDTHVQMEYR